MEKHRVMLLGCQSGRETVHMILSLEKSIQVKVIVWLWRWWSARNKVNEGHRLMSASEIQNSIVYHLLEFERLNNTGQSVKKLYYAHGSHDLLTTTRSILTVPFTQRQE